MAVRLPPVACPVLLDLTSSEPRSFCRSLASNQHPMQRVHAVTSGGHALPAARISSRHSQLGRLVRRAQVDRDLDWEPDIKRPATAPSRGGSRYTPPPPPAPSGMPKTAMVGGRVHGARCSSPHAPPTSQRACFTSLITQDWVELPFRSRRNIALTMLGGGAALWVLEKSALLGLDGRGLGACAYPWMAPLVSLSRPVAPGISSFADSPCRCCCGTAATPAEVLAPVQVGGVPPPDFPFQLAGYTDVGECSGQHVAADDAGRRWATLGNAGTWGGIVAAAASWQRSSPRSCVTARARPVLFTRGHSLLSRSRPQPPRTLCTPGRGAATGWQLPRMRRGGST